jgi:hypothetical protein
MDDVRRYNEFETRQQGSRWFAASVTSASHDFEASGSTEAEALAALCESILEAWSLERLQDGY